MIRLLDLGRKTALPKRPASNTTYLGTKRHQSRYRPHEEERFVGLRNGEGRIQVEVTKRRRRPNRFRRAGQRLSCISPTGAGASRSSSTPGPGCSGNGKKRRPKGDRIADGWDVLPGCF